MGIYKTKPENEGIYKHIKYVTSLYLHTIPLSEADHLPQGIKTSIKAKECYGNKYKESQLWVSILTKAPYRNIDNDYYTHGDFTYWIMPSDHRPTQEESLRWIFEQILFVMDHNYNIINLGDYLNKKRWFIEDLNISLNIYKYLEKLINKFNVDILNNDRFDECLFEYELYYKTTCEII
jgi:hypothetical protein